MTDFWRRYTEKHPLPANIYIFSPFVVSSIHYGQGEVWNESRNKNLNPLYGITMGSKHGAEVCGIVGLYIMSKLKEKPNHKKLQFIEVMVCLIAINKK